MTQSSITIDLVHTAWLPAAQLHASSPIDLTCNVSEVRRLLWSVLSLAVAVGVYAVLRPSWRLAGGLAAAAVLWLWIDMEGPVLISRGSHGLHFADVPVVVALFASAMTALRLLWLRARHPATAT